MYLDSRAGTAQGLDNPAEWNLGDVCPRHIPYYGYEYGFAKKKNEPALHSNTGRDQTNLQAVPTEPAGPQVGQGLTQGAGIHNNGQGTFTHWLYRIGRATDWRCKC